MKRYNHTQYITRANFTFAVEGDLVTITDLNLGNMSVTNDAENVLLAIHNDIDLTGKRVQYYDSEGQLDRLLHENGVFKGFAPGPWQATDA